jgi:hypothetical protein
MERYSRARPRFERVPAESVVLADDRAFTFVELVYRGCGAHAVPIMSNTALTGTIYDIDGGQ